MRPEPQGPKEQIADQTLTFLERALADIGLTLDTAFITFTVEQKDIDGHNATTVFHAEGDEELPDLLGFLLAQARGVARELGLRIIIGDMRGGPLS